jgi:hypothetical protein
MRHAKGLCHVGPVGVGFIQPLQLVADLAQQVFPPRNVGVGFRHPAAAPSTTPSTPWPSSVCATITSVGMAVAQ